MMVNFDIDPEQNRRGPRMRGLAGSADDLLLSSILGAAAMDPLAPSLQFGRGCNTLLAPQSARLY